MKSYNLFFILSIAITLLINAGHAFGFGGEREGFYEIITYYPNGYVTDNKNPEYVEYVNGVIGTIRDTIMNNVSTYENPSKLDELQKSYEERLQKNNLVDDYNNYGYIYQVMTIEDSTLFYAYLSVPLVEKVRAIPGIDYCELPITFDVDGIVQPPNEEPVAEQPVAEPVAEQPVAEPVAEQPVAEPVAEPVTEPVAEQPVAEQPVAEPVTEPVAEQPVAEQNQDNVICEKKNQAETFYTIFAHYPKGEFDENDPEYIKYLNDLIEYIHYIIIKNRSNYQNPRKLDEIQKKYEETKSTYALDYGNYGTVYRTVSDGDSGIIMLSAYLNEKNADEVKNLEGISSVSIPTKYTPDNNEGVAEEEETICFEVDDTIVDEPIQAPELPKVEQKEMKLVCEPRVPTEDFYNIVAKHEYGEFIIEDPEFQYYLENFMKSIDKIIYNNKDTYQDVEVVKDLHKVFNTEYNKREMDFENSGSVKVLSLNEDDGTIVLSAYLNSITAEEVKKLSTISSVEQSQEGPATDEYCHEVEVDSINPDVTTAVEVDDDIPVDVDEDVTSDVDSDSEDDAVQCFSISLGYPCCSEGAQVYYEDNDGKWGYENNNWCGVSN